MGRRYSRLVAASVSQKRLHVQDANQRWLTSHVSNRSLCEDPNCYIIIASEEGAMHIEEM